MFRTATPIKKGSETDEAVSLPPNVVIRQLGQQFILQYCSLFIHWGIRSTLSRGLIIAVT